MSPEVSAEGGVTEQDKAAKSPVGMAKSLAQKYNVSFQLISTTDVATNQELIKQIATVNASSRVWPIETLLERPETFTGAVFAIEESYIVNARERENVVGFKLDHILFDFDKVDIDIQFTEELEAVGKLVRDNPDSYIVLAGFTDSQGTEEYNLGLSKRRVEAVKDYLVNKFQIAEERIGAFWYGEAAPIADNNTEAGRQKNRRVLGYITGVK